MRMVNVEWFEDDNIMKGYKWSVQAKYGIVETSQEELFSRVEFECLDSSDEKVVYAVSLGWRFNVDNQRWYRIKGH